jgi:ATP-dependent helicase YprA (DUF1998 family)
MSPSHEALAPCANTTLDIRQILGTLAARTTSDACKAIRERRHIVLTNPDMLHTGILPHHTRWMRLFENPRRSSADSTICDTAPRRACSKQAFLTR